MTSHTKNNAVSSAAPDRGPLHGLRIVDFTIIMSGPMCTRALADEGADVIKVEPPSGDATRQRAPFRSGTSTYFAALNCGKKSVVLDLATLTGRQLAKQLTEKADVVVENFRPGVMKKLGLDYETLRQKNPRLIYCSISGFGQTGPMAHAPAYAPVIHAASGYEAAFMAYQPNSSKPATNGIFVADALGAAQATSAVHLALYDRERTGAGQHLDVSLMDSIMSLLVFETQDAQYPTGRTRQLYHPVRALDGYVMVAAVTPKNLVALFAAIDFPQGSTDPRFASVRAKEENWSLLLEIIEGWTSLRTAIECERILMEAGVPCARYRTVGQAMAEPQTIARKSFQRLGTQDEPFLVANPPYQLSAASVHARQRLAGLGENNREVVEMLGYSVEEFDQFEAAGAFGKGAAAPAVLGKASV